MRVDATRSLRIRRDDVGIVQFMASCSICGAQTELLVNGRPMCVACTGSAAPDAAQVKIRAKLEQAERTARVQFDAAMAELRALANPDSPTLPADATGRARSAVAAIGPARACYENAHQRLLDFLVNGVVPDDLRHLGE